MKVFVTGASGFIGQAVATALVARGHHVRGLIRDPDKRSATVALGIEPVMGVLDNAALLTREARQADVVVNAADSDHRGAAEALLEGLRGSGNALLHTSGSSIVSDQAMGEPSERLFYENTPIEPLPDKVARVAIDQLVLTAPDVRSVVLCCTMLYGHRDWRARASARPPAYIGRGLNRWSNAHIDDAAELYCLALEKAEPGTFLYVESGEEELGLLARHAATLLGLPHAHALDPTYAVEMLGREVAVFALGSNSRVRGAIGRDLLGWRPRHHSIVKWLDTADDESRPYV